MKLVGTIARGGLLTGLFATQFIGQATFAADPADRWLIRARGIVVQPLDDSDRVFVNGTAVAGSGVSVDSDPVPELDFTYMITPNWGAELILATSNHTVTAEGSLAGLGDVIDADVLPPTLLAQYHFNPAGRIRPYVGVGLNVTWFYDEDVEGPLDQAGAKVDLDGSVGVALQAGVDLEINDHWFFNADFKWIQMDTTATFTNTTAGRVQVDADINPVVFGAGIGYRF